MISNNSSLQALSYQNMPKISIGGRAYIPVSPSQVVYSHFKYVSGFAKSGEQSGVSVDKLRILNSIIDQLVSMKTNEAQKAEFSKSSAEKLNGKLNEEQLDNLLKYYHNEVKNSIQQTENIGYGGVVVPANFITLTG